MSQKESPTSSCPAASGASPVCHRCSKNCTVSRGPQAKARTLTVALSLHRDPTPVAESGFFGGFMTISMARVLMLLMTTSFAAGAANHAETASAAGPTSAFPIVGNGISVLDRSETSWSDSRDGVKAPATFNKTLTARKTLKFRENGFALTEKHKDRLGFALYFNDQQGHSHKRVDYDSALRGGPYQLSNGLILVISGSYERKLDLFDTHGNLRGSVSLRSSVHESFSHVKEDSNGNVVIGSTDRFIDTSGARVRLDKTLVKFKTYTLKITATPGTSQTNEPLQLANQPR